VTDKYGSLKKKMLIEDSSTPFIENDDNLFVSFFITLKFFISFESKESDLRTLLKS
jgi:hypothetical protein